MTKPADPRNDVAFKKIFSENNIENIKNFAEYGFAWFWDT